MFACSSSLQALLVILKSEVVQLIKDSDANIKTSLELYKQPSRSVYDNYFAVRNDWLVQTVETRWETVRDQAKKVRTALAADTTIEAVNAAKNAANNSKQTIIKVSK